MRKPLRHYRCRKCGLVKEPVPQAPPQSSEHGFARYRISGNLKPPRGRYLNAMKCPACYKGVIWLYHESLPRFARRSSLSESNHVTIVAVEPDSWARYPSSYFIRGKHEMHQNHCPTFMDKVQWIKQIRNSDLYVECPEIPK